MLDGLFVFAQDLNGFNRISGLTANGTAGNNGSVSVPTAVMAVGYAILAGKEARAAWKGGALPRDGVPVAEVLVPEAAAPDIGAALSWEVISGNPKAS
ncbi:hypothetical protein MAMC_01888 [Methylacidimicrobium cyclopophantes]|uniref:Uncharacterized protein n=1 Tax=Methylacidimicrobium cyclopophantes TaxID=1041766 RepID=A0A5E6MHX7_9BACT|nr:hypothetical protein MAMC_01888 [Methylacidimicrobium cyclopophantes]